MSLKFEEYSVLSYLWNSR